MANLSPDDLRARIGRPRARKSTVLAWFRREFGTVPVKDADGWPMISEPVLDDLQRKRYGLIADQPARPSVRTVR